MPSPEHPFTIIILGPPVSGKGTQARLLAQTFDIPHIAIGQMLHTIEHDAGHPLHRQIAPLVAHGRLVADEIVNDMIYQRIQQSDCAAGFALDGYPRTLAQAQWIDSHADINYVFLIRVSDDLVVERISGRRVCSEGHIWHVKYAPTKIADVCDYCGGALRQRADDQPHIAKDRLLVYHSEIDPIARWYREREILLEINGDQVIENVFQEMVRYLVRDLRRKAQV